MLYYWKVVIRMKKSYRQAVYLFLIVLFAGLMAWHQAPSWAKFEAARDVAFREGKTTISTYDEVYFFVIQTFVHPVKGIDLLNGSLQAVEKFLKEKKIEAKIPPLVSVGGDEEDLRLFHDKFKELESIYGEKLKEDDLLLVSLHGMLVPLDDPYTNYLTPKDYRFLNEQMSGGNFGGIGIYIELDKNNNSQLMVTEPIENTPAWKAGLKPGDYILKIDGETTKGISLDVAQMKIRGHEGTQVTLTIMRKGFKEPRNFMITRGLIHVNSVVAKLMAEDIGYVKLRNFGEFTGREIEEGLEKVEKDGAKAFILDLRNNGGGYITAAFTVSSKFLPQGAMVCSVVDRGERTMPHYTEGGQHMNYPLAVLVNEFSASASEITAGAIQDHGRGTLVGAKTFGKASVQTIRPLRNGGGIKVTTAKYLTPHGRDISKKGIVPDVVIAMKGHALGGEEDIQLKKAIGLLKQALASQ